MAPSAKHVKPAETPKVGDLSAPLADYFFIAGIESSQVYDARLQASPPDAPVEDTIKEDEALVTIKDERPATPGSRPVENGTRWSKYSFEGRKSIGSIIVAESSGTGSNRSSVTIKPAKTVGGSGLSDDAFEEALKKFASERENFLEDIQFTAGAVQAPTQKKPRPKTVRIMQDEDGMGAGLKGPAGSLSRRLSTMRSMGRSTSAMSRHASVRTSKRLSGYNSVIPPPRPFSTSSDMHPLKRRYEPVLLDRYPPKGLVDETKRRSPFPDYVPMFTFPNDVTVLSSDERPRSTWHGFAMTNQDNKKLYGVCVTIWIPLNEAASSGLERQCEEWRRVHMSDEERELASSLGERLSTERAKLSTLLANLPSTDFGSAERDKLEEDISAVEEKISLMTDLLRPVRLGAASKIDGLTEGETGFWIPRVYGILGHDSSMMSFWKEWLKAVIVPMMNGSVLRVPPSSPKVGVWQPLERYVVNLCVEALSPITSITQVEVAVRDLRIYARREAINELPGSRTTDLYALFRSLTIPNIITLFEYALSESRIILLSSHTAMLHLATAALTSLLFPLNWCGVLIPVLPQRLIQALEAPCPYIAGVERRYEKLELPDDDFCVVDLDENTIESTAPPIPLPRPQRRKLMALLQVAAQHHNRYGVPVGPPQYAMETFPCDAFSSENPQLFDPRPEPSSLAAYVSESSTTFGNGTTAPSSRTSVYNAFLHARPDATRGADRPSTSSTGTGDSTVSSHSPPPTSVAAQQASTSYSPFSASRNDSGLALQASLREKRSAGRLNDNLGRRNSAVHSLFNARNPSKAPANDPSQYDPHGNGRRPSAPMFGHYSSSSTSSLGQGAGSNYAPSVYAQSTLAASTIMPSMMVKPVRDDERTKWVEGHCMQRRNKDIRNMCTICDERCHDESFRCIQCGVTVHNQCLTSVNLPCPYAFRADQIRAAFVRTFASLFYTYRKHLHPTSASTTNIKTNTTSNSKSPPLYNFNMDAFLRSCPHGDSEYMSMLRQTQAFNEFIHERETHHPSSLDSNPTSTNIKLFDEIILSKRNRGRMAGVFGSKSKTSFLADTSEHLWRSASATPPNTRFPGDSRTVSGRTPAKLDPAFMAAPRTVQGAPNIRLGGAANGTKRKPVGSLLGMGRATDGGKG